eukprot:snap_masked-scaffold_44-processed-gene-1.71-mRNA-1 protein AED:1.00 eAED:1.00 QI:0/0/0/0/1/1/2/0/201
MSMSFPFIGGTLYLIFSLILPINQNNNEINISPGLLMDFVIVWPLRVILPWYKEKEVDDVSLKHILNSDIGLKLFKSYMVYELTIENLNFYLVATKWRENFGKLGYMDSKKIAKNIVSRWIGNDNIYGNIENSFINIGYDMSQKIKERIEERVIDETLFDEAIQEVYKLIWVNSFSRFKSTTRYKNFIGAEDGLDIETMSL